MTSTSIYAPFVPDQYCVYHTTYSGTLLPQNYIGSSSVDRVLNDNYHGSVSSARYKDIWNSEIKLHPELFNTDIISYHDTRSNATHKELMVQMIFNVVKSGIFINRAYAKVNGWCDIVFTPEEKSAAIEKQRQTISNKTLEQKAVTKLKTANTNKNKTIEENSSRNKKRIDTNNNKTPEQKAVTKLKTAHTKNNKSPEQKAASKNRRSDAQKGRPKRTCPHCNISGGASAMIRYHFANCKANPIIELIQTSCA